MNTEGHGRGAPGARTATLVDDGDPLLLLFGHLRERAIAIPAMAIERILRMAALTPLPGAPPGVAGVLNLHGTIVPVVDPRPALGLAPVPCDPAQHLVVVSAGTRYLLWLDHADQMVAVPRHALTGVAAGAGQGWAPFVLHRGGMVMPILSVEAFDPGPVLLRRDGSPAP